MNKAPGLALSFTYTTPAQDAETSGDIYKENFHEHHSPRCMSRGDSLPCGAEKSIIISSLDACVMENSMEAHGCRNSVTAVPRRYSTTTRVFLRRLV